MILYASIIMTGLEVVPTGLTTFMVMCILVLNPPNMLMYLNYLMSIQYIQYVIFKIYKKVTYLALTNTHPGCHQTVFQFNVVFLYCLQEIHILVWEHLHKCFKVLFILWRCINTLTTHRRHFRAWHRFTFPFTWLHGILATPWHNCGCWLQRSWRYYACTCMCSWYNIFKCRWVCWKMVWQVFKIGFYVCTRFGCWLASDLPNRS